MQKHNAAIHALTGGEIDGGIAPPAQQAFIAWVDAVRASLGARRRDDLLVVADSDKLKKALHDSFERYAAYKQLRDKFEIDEFNNRRERGRNFASFKAALDAARLPDGDYKVLRVPDGGDRDRTAAADRVRLRPEDGQ